MEAKVKMKVRVRVRVRAQMRVRTAVTARLTVGSIVLAAAGVRVDLGGHRP